MTERNEIILIGHDNPALKKLTEQIETCGCRPIQISFGDEARARVGRTNVGMVIVALESGPESLEWIREINFLYRGLPVMAAAFQGSVTEAREAIGVGAVDYVLLPIEDDLLKTHLNNYLARYFDPELGNGRRLLSSDPNMKRLLNQIRRVGKSQATVLIQGESGTGKELIARFVHQVSDRSSQAFVALNCAALPENLLESELFGHTKGAFTGAITDRKGKFLQANGGTIFLDEISEMSLNLQAKLLRVLQEREVDPVGGRGAVPLDVRVVASTNRDLKEWAEDGKFREDLYYRLNVFPVSLPPLRKRAGDILLLANHFRKRFITELGRNDIPFSPAALNAMERYSWPGNIRELENVIQRALLMAEGRAVEPEDLMIDADCTPDEEEGTESSVHHHTATALGDHADAIRLPIGTTVREMEEILIHRTLDEVNGNRTRAAELLGISIRTLRNKLNEYATR
ncbi:MAG: sigma-54-dependent Fis family transcriptional regulator [Magnetococcales bacterium]|nr:sigma-54-dependent Fis family transcriptional regulator [Magnetococcales bacterium]MBF0174537.1 sigma-54-dependent Fis family transcriptional regulator [Magnetococcales bacterium]MBF0632808.1 sigma-54-dependent Fis family transcriptional regulator [Magnetococcales bacterium]